MAAPAALKHGWLDRETRALAARAVFAEVALQAGGIWDPRELEATIRRRNNDRRGSRDLSNYRNMWDGKHAPSKAILKEALRAYPDAQVEDWAEHPLFFLLNKPKRDIATVSEAAIAYALDSIPGPLRGLIWQSEISYEPWTGEQLLNLNSAAISAILNDSAFDELCALYKVTTCAALAKYAISRNDSKSFVRASQITHTYFVEAVLTTPHLYIQWQQLQTILAQQFWEEINQILPRELKLPLDRTKQIARLANLVGFSV